MRHAAVKTAQRANMPEPSASDSNRVDPAPEVAKEGPDAQKLGKKEGLTTAGFSVTADTPEIGPVATPPLTPTPESDTIAYSGPNIYRRYSALMHKYLKLSYELQELKRPTRTQEQIERQLGAIQRFLGTMNDSEGAVTAANLYNEDFFAGEFDSKFKVPLLHMLLERFVRAEPLIVPTYNYWVTLLEKEKSV